MSSTSLNEQTGTLKQRAQSSAHDSSDRHGRQPTGLRRARTYEVQGDTGEDIVGPFITGTDEKGKHLMEYAIKCPYTEVEVHHSNGTIEKIKRGKGFNGDTTGGGAKVPFVGRKRFIKNQEKLYTSPIPGPTDITIAPARRQRGSTSSTDSDASYYTNEAPYTGTLTRTVGATPDFQHEQTIDFSYAVQPQELHHRDGKVERVSHMKLMHATLRKGSKAGFAFRNKQLTRFAVRPAAAVTSPVWGPVALGAWGVHKIRNR